VPSSAVSGAGQPREAAPGSVVGSLSQRGQRTDLERSSAALSTDASAPCIVIPAFNAERTIGHVVSSLLDTWGRSAAKGRLIVVNDGSVDATAELARRAGAYVLSHAVNRGKGAALLSGLEEAQRRGAASVVTLDADGQHFADDALTLLHHPAPADALLLGIRNLERAHAPRANRFSNALSNFFLSWFSGTQLNDTQCGLRRYPVTRTLAANASARGFAFETEILLIAALQRWDIEQLPIEVHYPPPGERTTHFDSVRDPTRIIATVVRTMTEHRLIVRRDAL
jgi:glycosyltransferase involved in cell wall biosynthesis